MTLHTENDLRAALAERALDHGAEPEVTDLRARLDALVTPDTGDGIAADTTAAELFDLVPPATRRRRRRGFVAGAVAAACAAVAAVALVATGVTHHSASPAADGPPKYVRAGFLPGERYVTTFSGTGPGTVTLPKRNLPAHFEWNAWQACTGTTTQFGVNGVASVGKDVCGPHFLGGGSFQPDHGRLHVQISGTHAASVRWTIWVTLAPQLRTNAGVVPADESNLPDAKAGTPNFATGTGNRAVTVRIGPDPGSVRLQLSCTGSGVTIPHVRVPLYSDKELYTHTCFAGRVYQWSELPLKGTVTLHIQASPNTRWRLLVD